MLKLYNSLTQKKEIFSTIKNKKATLYVCGITPYDTTHLGHAYTYIFFDVLVRFLQYRGYEVKYTQNVTDINDRDNDLLKKAFEENTSWQKISKFWTKRFLENMNTLNWVLPSNYIKASENISEMINLINSIIKNGYGYEKNGSVYLDISRKKDFGKLSRFDKSKMIKIAKEFEEDIENKDKRNPLDITLWRAKEKNQKPHIPSFDSPYGKGRPGWHIECSSMAISTLSEQIDIHGGGMDLMFPHHECEIAQSETATLKTPFSKFWVHVSPVFYKGEKMSKSLGNVIMVNDLTKNYSGDVVRWYLISNHYRKGFEFKEKDIEKSKKEYLKILDYINENPHGKDPKGDYFYDFLNALDDDLDTPLALDIIRKIYQNKESSITLKKCLSILGFSSYR